MRPDYEALAALANCIGVAVDEGMGGCYETEIDVNEGTLSFVTEVAKDKWMRCTMAITSIVDASKPEPWIGLNTSAHDVVARVGEWCRS